MLARLVGLSILSGSHASLAAETLAALKAQGLADLPVVLGGIVPEADAQALRAAGIARIYTPKDYQLATILADIAGLVEARCAA